MLKIAFEDKSGGKMIGFGLTRENMRRMLNDEPMLIDLKLFGLEGRVILFGGETEETMAKDFQELIGPDTKLEIDPRLMGGHD